MRRIGVFVVSRLFLLIALVVLVYWVARNYLRKSENSQESPPPAAAEDMVICAQCGVHFPKSEGVAAQGRYYCSEAHRRESSHL